MITLFKKKRCLQDQTVMREFSSRQTWAETGQYRTWLVLQTYFCHVSPTKHSTSNTFKSDFSPFKKLLEKVLCIELLPLLRKCHLSSVLTYLGFEVQEKIILHNRAYCHSSFFPVLAKTILRSEHGINGKITDGTAPVDVFGGLSNLYDVSTSVFPGFLCIQ